MPSRAQGHLRSGANEFSGIDRERLGQVQAYGNRPL